ncbi:hypothetical protein [Achromobacter sp. NCFB-sbj8-Ac1-l]|uniref:hypothetical protein n=1 Tax=unclassified Achromobacter TaxID=2626865 RepID=UPI004046E68C
MPIRRGIDSPYRLGIAEQPVHQQRHGDGSNVLSSLPILPRLQALGMKEAACMAKKGVTSTENTDTPIRLAFGLRLSALSLLEFIDWGGGGLLH